VRHMASKINEVITGEYDHKGKAIIYGDTDSVAYDSVIRTDQGNRTIEELFMAGDVFWQQGDKEYSRNDSIKVASYDPFDKSAKLSNYLYVYRHKVRKKKYRITTSNGKTVDVTEDHSVMVLEEGKLVEKKPIQLKESDVILTIIS
jgi:intein/homing endonuclease